MVYQFYWKKHILAEEEKLTLCELVTMQERSEEGVFHLGIQLHDHTRG